MDGMTLEKLQVLIEAQTKGFRDEISKVQNEVKRMTNSVNNEVNKVKNIFKSLGRFVVTLGIGKMFVNSVQSAMKVEAAIQQITRTMGESTNQFLKWSKANALAFNMSQLDAMNYGAIFSNLVSTFSSGTKETLQYTTDLLKASSIIASGTGRTMEDVMERIRSGLLGNTEAIEDLGVNVNVAMLQSTEAFKRFANGKSWDQLSFQTQQQIRLMAILEQTSNKFGGEVFSNTNSSLQQFVAVLKDVALNIGNAFLPIMNVVMPILTNFAMGLRTVTAYVATFMQTLFGYKPSSKTGVGGATGQVNSLGNAATKTGEKAKKAQKEVSRLLGGFDEINVLSKNSSSDSGNTGISAPTGGGLLDFSNAEILEPDTSGLEAAVNKFKDIFRPVAESFENLKKSLNPFIDNVAENLKWFWDEILVPFGTWSISSLIPAFFNVLAGALDIINPIIDVFQEQGAWLWDRFLQPIASWTGGVIVDVLNGLANVLKSIGNWMKEHKTIVNAMTTVVVSFFAAWKLTELMGFIQMSGGIAGVFAKVTKAIKACTLAKLIDKAETIYLTSLYAKDFIVSVAKGTVELIKQAGQWTINTGLKIANTAAQVAMNVATGAWNVICGIATAATSAFGAAISFLTSPIGLVIIAIGAVIAIGVLLVKHWDEVKEKCGQVWDWIKDKFNQFKEWLGNVFATDWSEKFGFLGDILNAYLTNVKTVLDGVKRFFSGIIDFIAGVFTGNWDRAWKGVKNIFKGIWDSFTGIAKAPINMIIGLINGMISAINVAIRGINKLSWEVPSWVPIIGGETWGFDIPQLGKVPYLAKGGIVDSATLAVIGEAGKEAVMPLENNTGWISLLADKLASRIPSVSNDSSFAGDLILMIDGSVIGRVALKQLKKMQRQGGITLMPV
ncbi:phage tail protein [Clostridium paraputrificum]|uniref:phage tail protein n=1 Tax=Clostridium paraputrificum TaxID=29363 RepID=UPI00374EFD93